MSTSNPWEEGNTADSAWNSLSSQKRKADDPGLVSGALAQLKEEIHFPTKAEIGASLVHSAANALRAGEEEWSKISQSTTEKPAEPKKPSVAVDVAKTIGAIALTAAVNAAGNAWARWKNRNQRGVTVYERPNTIGGDPDIIDGEATEVE